MIGQQLVAIYEPRVSENHEPNILIENLSFHVLVSVIIHVAKKIIISWYECSVCNLADAGHRGPGSTICRLQRERVPRYRYLVGEDQ